MQLFVSYLSFITISLVKLETDRWNQIQKTNLIQRIYNLMATPNQPNSLECTTQKIDFQRPHLPQHHQHYHKQPAYQPYQDQPENKAEQITQPPTTPEPAKPNVTHRCISRMWIILLVFVLAVAAGILIYQLTAHSPSTSAITAKTTKAYFISATQNMYQSHYDYAGQDGRTQHFEVIALSSGQDGNKYYSASTKTPILMNSGYVRTTQWGQVVIDIDPQQLLDELNKLQQANRNLQQHQQGQSKTEQSKEQNWPLDYFWTTLFDKQHGQHQVYRIQYVACQEQPASQQGQYTYAPLPAKSNRLLAQQRLLLSAQIVPFLQQNACKQTDYATQMLNSLGKQIQSVDRNKYSVDDQTGQVSNQQKRDLLNAVSSCFDRDNIKYCPKEVWNNPNSPFKVDPPFDPSQSYLTRPIFTIQRTGTQGQVSGDASAGGSSQSTTQLSSSEIAAQSGADGNTKISAQSSSQKGNSLTSGQTKGQASVTSSAAVRSDTSFSQSTAGSGQGIGATVAATQSQVGNTATDAAVEGPANVATSAVVSGNIQTTSVQAASQQGGSAAGGGSTSKSDKASNAFVQTDGNGNGGTSASIADQIQKAVSEATSQLGGNTFVTADTTTTNGSTHNDILTNGPATGVAASYTTPQTQTSTVQTQSGQGGLGHASAQTDGNNGKTSSYSGSSGLGNSVASGTLFNNTQSSNSQGGSQQGGSSIASSTTSNSAGSNTGSAVFTSNGANAVSNALTNSQLSTSVTQLASGQNGSAYGTSGTQTNTSKTTTSISASGPATGYSNAQVDQNGSSSYTSLSSQGDGSASSTSQTYSQSDVTSTQVYASGNNGGSANINSSTNISNAGGVPAS